MSKISIGAIVLDRYEIRSELGSGGMATVYRAYDRVRSSEVALKMPDPQQLTTAARRERFLQEFATISRLEHPAIVRVYDQLDLEEGTPFFSMELLDGSPLTDRISRREASAPRSADTSNLTAVEEALAILKQVAHGLDHIHSKGIVYCDLKPSNLIVTSTGQLKFIDFGIARQVAEQEVDSEAAGMIGTTYFMSPEQIRGDALDPRSDIYSFGVLAFELLTGNVPFPDEAAFTVTASHLAAKVPSARERNPQVPAALDRMIRVCMEKEKHQRYAAMRELIQRLEAIKLAKSPSRFSQLWRRLQKRTSV